MMMDSFLIIRKFGHIGDFLMLTPSLKQLSKRYKIDLQISPKYKGVFENLSFINKIYSINDKVEGDSSKITQSE